MGAPPATEAPEARDRPYASADRPRSGRPVDGQVGAARVQSGCAGPQQLSATSPEPYCQYMEPVAAVSLDSAGRRPVGWQMQQRVDFVVNRAMQTHRGEPEEKVAQAIREELRSLGVVPNGREVAHYASVIAQLPQLPPRSD